jgi:spermidine/putrescine transport system substrate-binding protein
MQEEHGTRSIYSRRRFLGASAAAGFAGLALAACGSSGSSSNASKTAAVKPKKDGSVLNLFAWQGYFAPSVISGFEKKYGIKVNQTYTTSGDDELSKVASGLPFDCCITNSTTLPQLGSAGVLREINHDYLSSYDQVITAFRDPYYDKGAKYSVGYAMAPFGLAWQANRTGDMTGSWNDLWTHAPKMQPHGYCVDGTAAISLGLMHLGYSENSNVQSQLDAAANSLIQLKPHLGGFESVNTIQILSSGQAWMIPTYTGNVYTAIISSSAAKKNLRFELCKEGQLFNADNLSISSSAAHPGNGMLFIDWNLQPANMAKNVQYTGYPVPTYAGLAAYKDLVADYPFLDVGTDEITNWGSWQRGLNATQQKMWDAEWTKVLAA